jgi:ubiquinol-cytochrome c reductase cytochrome b subunit
VLGPVAAFLLTRRVCLALQKRDRDILLHGYETGRIVRLPGGEYLEAHGRVDASERYRLAGPAAAHATPARPDDGGRLRLTERLRAALARVFFEDRLEPLDPATAAAAGLTAGDGVVDGRDGVDGGDGVDGVRGGGRTDEAIERGTEAHPAGVA